MRIFTPLTVAEASLEQDDAVIGERGGVGNVEAADALLHDQSWHGSSDQPTPKIAALVQ
jgi:hypothetical protein